MKILSLLLLVLSLLLLASCVTQQVQKLNPAVYYKQDLCVRENIKKGKSFCGTGVLPYRSTYDLRVTGFGKLNFFGLTSCHFEDTSENPDKGIFKKKGRVNIKYTPTLEKTYACPLYISAFNRSQRHAWGIVAFENPKYKLEAHLECNGVAKDFNGISICQSKKGLIQRITFKEPVKLVKPVVGAADRSKPCPVIGEDGGKSFTFKLPSRECVYGFIGRTSGKVHKLFSIGYEEIIIRE